MEKKTALAIVGGYAEGRISRVEKNSVKRARWGRGYSASCLDHFAGKGKKKLL